jgi:hypothetical protein
MWLLGKVSHENHIIKNYQKRKNILYVNIITKYDKRHLRKLAKIKIMYDKKGLAIKKS